MIAVLYIGTFGSFIGYSFAFGQILQINFLATPKTTAAAAALHAAQIAFIGPLLGSLSRPIGGGSPTGSAAARSPSMRLSRWHLPRES
jgi:NNP family nitrate/nitrite transporter-like MFS transporter